MTTNLLFLAAGNLLLIYGDILSSMIKISKLGFDDKAITSVKSLQEKSSIFYAFMIRMFLRW